MLGKIFKREKGITLVALAVTIIVLIILASIGINLAFSDNGIIKEAQNAKESAEIDEEQGILKRAITISLIKSTGTNIEQSVLEKALNDEIGEGKTEVSDVGEYFEVIFTESNRYYKIDEDGKIGEVQYFVKDEYAGDITKGGRCDGSEEKPYEISCIEDLVVLSNMCNGAGIKFENGEAVEVTGNDVFLDQYIILTRSLNFQSKYSYADSTRTDFGDINGDETDGNMLITEMTTGTGFLSIGSWKAIFQGIFDGKENSIQNLYTKKYGLFGEIKNASIINLGISGEIESDGYAGGVISYATSSIIKNCYSKVNIIAADDNIYGKGTGGIIGTSNNSIIEDCYNEGNIYGKSWVGGISGALTNGSQIINCYNLGEINSEGTKIYTGCGGIVGGALGEGNVIKECYNKGKIDNGNVKIGVGGIIGCAYSQTSIEILNCCNYQNITGYRVGGILGIGEVVSSGTAGLLTIENCYNRGNINGDNDAGGIVGTISMTYDDATYEVRIIHCFNYGKIDATKFKGEICGEIYKTKDVELEKCYYVANGYGLVGKGQENCTTINTEGKELSFIKSKEFIDLLNSYTDDTGVYPSNWKKWKMGDEGYPVFED